MWDEECDVGGFDLAKFLPYRISVAAARVSRGFAKRYRTEFGISIPEWRVLAHLSAAGGPVSVREVHARVDMDKSKVSRAAARLEQAGYVAKAENSDDRRLVQLTLTEAGRDLVARIVPVARSYHAELLARLGPEADSFRRALERLATEEEEDRLPEKEAFVHDD
ncbi:MarR family winged helix-turn-helix transcriptional regulator [Ostreiculturibacter nitratireducens]|uniref:MarR family winged helix-turn-helix transcriptional regulator n=1 Tax=Ostreiculturibacter nitratireducens TaxID=3075226 RepID=UPI0031B64F94